MGLPLIGDAFDAAKKIVGGGIDAVDSAGSSVGEAFKDFSNVGKNRFTATPYQTTGVQFGGEGGADRFSAQAQGGMAKAGQGQNYAMGQMTGNRGPQAFENQALADREAQARGYDQAGALQLARQAAMGKAPSEAAYAMQAGLNQSNAMQQSMAGGARGGAAMALAQGNAQAAVAGNNQQAFNEAGRLRAQEMAQARGQYGGLAGQQRDQDLQRLQMGNQMSQFNAGLNDQYKLGMGQLGVQYGQMGQGWFQGSMDPYKAQAELDAKAQGINAQSYNDAQAINAGVAQGNADEAGRMRDRWVNFGVGGAKTIGSMAPSAGPQGGGSGGK